MTLALNLNLKNAVIYARYSSHSQTEMSIDGQLNECARFARAEGYTVIGEYIDRALTGRIDNRPEFQRMIADAAKKQFQYIIVWKFDRFARNRYDSAIYKNKLKKSGVRVLSANEKIADNPSGVLLEAILEGMAEFYSENMRADIKRGISVAKQKGQYTGGGVPIGYKAVGKRIEIDEAKADIIRHIFAAYAAGEPRKKIIDEINSYGLKSRSGKPFGHTAFIRALCNAKYLGVSAANGAATEYPQLIDEKTFYAAAERAKKNRRAPSVANQNAVVKYLLFDKAFCGNCGARLIGYAGTGKSGKVHHYYSCSARKRRHSCNKKNEIKDFLEWYVVEQTMLYVLTPERTDFIAGHIVDEYNKEFCTDEVSKMESKIARLELEKDKAITAMIDASSSAARKALDTKIQSLQDEIDDYAIDLAKLRIASKIKLTKDEVTAWLKSFSGGDLMDEDFRRRVIDTFINSVYLYDDMVVMYFNIRDSKQVSFIEMLDSTDDIDADEDDDDTAAPSEKQNAPDDGSGVRTVTRVVEVNRTFRYASHLAFLSEISVINFLPLKLYHNSVENQNKN